jgi:hypothetical protein
MFRKSYKITVKNSCEEDWKRMIPDACGRYCNSCSNLVHDYTNLSTSEIIKSLESSSEQKCGRFRADQLNKEFYIENQNNIKRKSLKYFLSLFIVSLQAKNVSGQTNDSTKNQINVVKVDSSLGVLNDSTLIQTVDSNSFIAEGDTTLNVDSIISSDSFKWVINSESDLIDIMYWDSLGITTMGLIYVEEKPSFWEWIKTDLNINLKNRINPDTEYSLALENKGEKNKEKTQFFSWEMILPPMFRFRKKSRKR